MLGEFGCTTASLRSRLAKFSLVTILMLVAAGHASAAQDNVTLPKTAPFPENLISTSDGALYVSSITNGGVVRVAPGATTAERFVKPGAFDTRSTFGLMPDEKAGLLWVASNDATAVGLKGPTAIEGAWIKAFDLKTGEGRFSVRLPASPAIANDFAWAPDGSLYVTNTAGSEIFKLAPGAKQLDLFARDDRFKGGLDGLAFGADGSLYVDTYGTGKLFRIELENGQAGKVTELKPSHALVHPDALRKFKDGFLMVEGGGTLDRVSISGDQARVDTVERFDGPTGVTIVGNLAWVSEGHLNYLSDPSKKGMQPASFNLRATSLPAAD